MSKSTKNPAAVELGRRGGRAGTPAQQAARATTLRRQRPRPDGTHRWMVAVHVDDDLRERVTAAVEAEGTTTGEWIARACRERLRGDVDDTDREWIGRPCGEAGR